ncbi:MAG: glycosyl hydrolase [Chloroflexota bacterium]
MHRLLPRPPASRLGSLILAASALLVALPAPAGAWTLVQETPAPVAAVPTSEDAAVTLSVAAQRNLAVPALVMPAGLPARRPLAMGVSRIEGYTASPDDDLAALDAFTRRTGESPASWSIWSDWGGPNAGFPARRLLDGLHRRGVQPVIFWQPTNPVTSIDPGRYAYARIAAGDWDGYLRSWAKDAHAYGRRILVRWAHEMNAPWFPWAIGKNGNTPATYKAAWRHIVTTVQRIAPNVRFMWAPNEPCGRCVPYAKMFPGDRYVNVVGFSAYNWTGKASRTMLQQYGRSIRALREVSNRGIVAAETGIAGPNRDRIRWIVQGYPQVYARFPRLRGVIYFDVDMRFAGHPAWNLTSRDGSLLGYREVIADPRFQGGL